MVTSTANIYAPLDRGILLLRLILLEVCTQINFVADFIQLNLNFIHKNDNSLFEPPFGGVRGNVRTTSIARWKARG